MSSGLGGDVQELMPEDPATIGPYRLSARLGEGGMGLVFLGQSVSGRRVAVKVVRRELAADPGFRQRFRREIEAARTVGGFWTAPVVDADPDAVEPWVASAYIEAPDLGQLVVSEGPLGEAGVRRLAAGLAEALEAIHRAGLVHRDLKPSNVLVTADGPRVIDFGISKALEGATTLTDTGLVVGTPGFMSPEQATGAAVGAPSDIFSLGAVLAFAATGRGPFGAGSVPALLYRVVHDVPRLDGVPEGVRGIVAQCLEKRAERRPSAAEVLGLLDRGGDGGRTGDAGAGIGMGAGGKAVVARPVPEPARVKARARAGAVPVRAPAAPTSPAVAVRPVGAEVVRSSVGTRGGGATRTATILAVVGVVSGVVAAVFALSSVLLVGSLAAVVFCVALTAAAIVKVREGRGGAPESEVRVDARELAYVYAERRWSSLWKHLVSVTLEVRQGPDAKIFGLVLTETVPGRARPSDFRLREAPGAVGTILRFGEMGTARAELGRLDNALRFHAGRRYRPHPSVARLLGRSPQS
ncbi:protein kinase [Streptomyces sp. NPDC006551]|uniref:serine/threonine-protein kinase n=1 Tax=Streptomyces sp. NPDC006551 TaxID=3157178 RepID=UPI0033B053B1